ncbi:MAG: SAM-dependent methyltransferase, partial [Oscillospiraceae bacterium]|nr:SAM-dependent methyltransferase [Oscillospiraceae bacterium]
MVDERESVTAKICAFVRAWHSNRSREKIYDDYLAYDMLGKEEYDSTAKLIDRIAGIPEGTAGEEKSRFIDEYFAPIPLSRIHFTEKGLAEFAEENGKYSTSYAVPD